MPIRPRTEAGRSLRRLLRAGALGATRKPRSLLKLDDDDPELAVAGLVFDAIVGLLVQRRFPRGTDVRDLHRYVTVIAAGLEPDESLPARETEAYLRARLGEPYLLAEVDPDRMGEPLGHLLVHLIRDVPLTKSDIDDLVVEAEGIADRLTHGTRVAGTWEVLAAGQGEESVEVPESLVVDWSAIARPRTSGSGPGETPRTRPGRYVRASVLLDKATRDQMAAAMQGTPEMTTTITIMRVLGRDLLRAAFPSPVDLRRLTATLAHIRAGFRATHLSLLEMDAVARDDLGEDAFAEGIPLRVRHTTRGTFVAATIQEASFTAREVDALVAAAEQQAVSQA